MTAAADQTEVGRVSRRRSEKLRSVRGKQVNHDTQPVAALLAAAMKRVARSLCSREKLLARGD